MEPVITPEEQERLAEGMEITAKGFRLAPCTVKTAKIVSMLFAVITMLLTNDIGEQLKQMQPNEN